MKYPAITKLILSKGVDAVTVPENIRAEVMSEAGYLLFKEGRYKESGMAFGKAKDTKAIIEIADWLEQQGRFSTASLFLLYSGAKERMEKCALSCMDQGEFDEAIRLYEKTGNVEMIHFIRKNVDL